MKKLGTLLPLPLFLVLVLALVLRLYKLSEFPAGFHADEARVGWNALSILKTGKDDWGNSFPLHYNTFGDFRPTGYFYLTVPALAIFGSNEFAVRFPAALFGALTIAVLYYLVLSVTVNRQIALLSALILALSPWHISLSRATSEGIVAVFLVLTGLWILVHSLKTGRTQFLPFLLSLLFLLSSYLFYHSARVLVPLFVATAVGHIWWQERSKLPHHKFGLALAVTAALFVATFLFALVPEARGRFTQISIFHDLDIKYELEKMPFDEGPGKVFIARMFHNKPSVWTRRFINEYTQYISAKFFLVPKEAKPMRYSTVGMGVLTYVEFWLFILGLIALAKKPKGLLLFLLLLLLAPLPAALTTEDAPNMHRSLFMVPFVATLSGYGLWYIQHLKPHGTLLRNILALTLTLNLVFFLHMYFVHNRVNNPFYRNVGAKELAQTLVKIKNEYNKVLVTNIPDSPYPWIAFFTSQDPQKFNQHAKLRDKGEWTFENFVFMGVRCPSRDAFQNEGKILAIDAEACEAGASYGSSVIIHEQIKRPDGTVVYTLWSRN